MPFEKNHKLGAKPLNDEAFDRAPICFNVRKGVREKLKTVNRWKERLIECVDELIQESGQNDEA